MADPFSRFNRNLEAPARRVFLITPNDDEDVLLVTKRVRIFNDTDATTTFAFITSGGDTVTFYIPPLSVLWEDILITRVLFTGTSANLIIHGYSDE
jgi:non-ribosomal peptide synthetase component E (peptide arylation enzyme)